MGLFDSLNPIKALSGMMGGGGGGGGGGGVSSGGIGSSTGNTSNAGNTTTTDTTNLDKRQVINSGAVGITSDSSTVTVNNMSSDPQNYAALLAVTEHLANGALGLLGTGTGTSATTSTGTSTSTSTGTAIADAYAKNKPLFVGLGVALVVWYVIKKG